MTAKNWTPPPKMPAYLPPLPMGRNGRPLVYLGLNRTFTPPKNPCHGYWAGGDSWYNGQAAFCYKNHYAAESDSEVCRLNQWGDFLPEATKAEPPAQPSTLEAYLLAIEKAIEDADKEWQKAVEVAAAWAEELKARREIRDALQGECALTRRAWYEQGRKDERHHTKVRTNFPLYP